MEELFKQLITKWREAFDSLTQEEKANISNLDDLQPPCQFEVISLENKKMDIYEQLWIISHFKDEPDLKVIIHGPINGVDATTKLPEISKSNRFERLLPEKIRFIGAKTYRDLIESHLLRLVESFRDSAINMLWSGQLPRMGVKVKSLLSEEAFVWEFQGVLSPKSINNIVTDSMKSTKALTKTKRQAQPITKAPKPKELKARGTYIYPHLWVGSRPLHSFEDDLTDKMYARQRYRFGYGEKVSFQKVGNFYALTTRDGFVAVTVEEISVALRILNSFMSLLTLKGVPALAVRENELVNLNLDLDTGKIGQSSSRITLPRMLPVDPTFIRPRWDEERMPILKVNTVNRIWKDVARMLKDDASVDLLLIFGEAYTHLQREEYPQTVLFASTIVERWYTTIRERAFEFEKQRKPQPRYRMVDILRSLDKEAFVDKEIIPNLYQLWQLRSQALHTSRYITKEDAQFALNTAVSVLQTMQEQ